MSTQHNEEWYVRHVRGALYVEITRPQPVAVAIDRRGGGLVMVTPDELRALVKTLTQVVEDLDAEDPG